MLSDVHAALARGGLGAHTHLAAQQLQCVLPQFSLLLHYTLPGTYVTLLLRKGKYLN